MAKKAEIDSDKDKVTVKAQKTEAGLKKEKKAPTKKTTAETAPAEQLSVPVKKTAAKKKTDKKTNIDTKSKADAKKKSVSKKSEKSRSARGSSAPLSEGKILIIVESPAKARTLEKILGPDYHVEASVGHVRDLPKGRIGIDIDNNFEPEYIQTRGKADIIKMLKKESAVSRKTLLASEDRKSVV